MINSNFPLLELALNNIWQSIAILALLLTVFKIVKNTSAEERSWSWSVAFFALAIMPFAAFLPGKGISFSKNEVPSLISIEAQATVTSSIGSKPKLRELPLEKVILSKYSKSNFLYIFLSIWALGVFIVFIKIARAIYNAEKIRKNASPYVIDDELSYEWPDHIEIALSDDINGPLVIGIIKPIILIPCSFVSDLKNEQLKSLLYHELAHINRYDNTFHLIERIILALYWWNPVMYFIAARLYEERELACDDRAAIKCGDQVLFAKSLLSGAKKLIDQDKTVLGMAALRRESVLSKRIKRMATKTFLKEFNMTRFLKTMTALLICVVAIGMVTPRFNKSVAQENDVSENVEKLLQDGGTAAVLEEMLEIEDEEVADYTKALLDRKELRPEEYKKLAEIIKNVEEDKLQGRALEQLVKRGDMDNATEKMVLSTVLGKERILKIRADVQKGLENLPTKEQIAEMENNIRAAMDNLPTEEMLNEMRNGIREGLANLPEHIEKEINVDEIIAEAEAGFNEMEIDIDFEEIRADMEKSLAELPDKKEIEQMRENLERSLEDILTEKDVEEMRRELQETLDQLPTGDET